MMYWILTYFELGGISDPHLASQRALITDPGSHRNHQKYFIDTPDYPPQLEHPAQHPCIWSPVSDNIPFSFHEKLLENEKYKNSMGFFLKVLFQIHSCIWPSLTVINESLHLRGNFWIFQAGIFWNECECNQISTLD